MPGKHLNQIIVFVCTVNIFLASSFLCLAQEEKLTLEENMASESVIKKTAIYGFLLGYFAVRLEDVNVCSKDIPKSTVW